jgi:sugar lactone lactonase YvrE
MADSPKITSIFPKAALPGGEVELCLEGIRVHPEWGIKCRFNGLPARLTGASADRVLAVMPSGLEGVEAEIVVEGADCSATGSMMIGELWAEDLHMVGNPATDPKDGSLVVTRSGSRGQKLPVTLFRIRGRGLVEEIAADVLNPTGLAFSPTGKLVVTNRADGEVCEVTPMGEVVPIASGLGVATGIAYDRDGQLFVGDRGGQIHKVGQFGVSEPFAVLEPSVAAYHMAFGGDGRLFVTAPGLSSHDSVYAIDGAGFETRYFRGLGRPQGLAFDRSGNLYVAACFRGRRGVVRIFDDGLSAELVVAGANVVGLCFGKEGDLFVATADSVFRVPLGVKGAILGE